MFENFKMGGRTFLYFGGGGSVKKGLRDKISKSRGETERGAGPRFFEKIGG